jgi:DNA-binding FadR family transcriptional regulator
VSRATLREALAATEPEGDVVERRLRRRAGSLQGGGLMSGAMQEYADLQHELSRNERDLARIAVDGALASVEGDRGRGLGA